MKTLWGDTKTLAILRKEKTTEHNSCTHISSLNIYVYRREDTTTSFSSYGGKRQQREAVVLLY